MKTLDLEGPTADTYTYIGAAYEQMAQYELGLKYFRKAVKIDNFHDEGWFGVGSCLSNMERWHEATHYLNKALKLNPENQSYWLAIASAEYQSGNVLSSVDAYEEASLIDPSMPSSRSSSSAGLPGW